MTLKRSVSKVWTDKTEKGFETLIVNHLVQQNGFEEGKNQTYSIEDAIDKERLFRFLQTTQPEKVERAGILNNDNKKLAFFNRLQGDITKYGVIDLLRNGFTFYPEKFDLFYQTPSEKNPVSKQLFEENIFSVTRQLHYSKANPNNSIDFVIFINGLPIITCELKNQLTGQTLEDAVYQYQSDRDPRELLLQFKRCMVHFAIDDVQIKFCTKLEEKSSWFLPFNKGVDGGAGNPVNPDGVMTDYLWKDVFTKTELANIIENYAQVVEEVDKKTKKKKYKQIFPRYHQLDVVKKLLADVEENGVGQKYLIQHSAGSGKSNSIAWLAHQMISLEKNGVPVVDSIIVVTDRVNLDKQIRDTIKQFMHMKNTVQWAEDSKTLREALDDGKKIIITTVHKFKFILEDVANQKNKNFAIIIDEAHSSQSGNMSANMNIALSGEYDPTDESTIEDLVNQLIESKKMLQNASYFAFTATPKNKTLEMFGVPYEHSGTVKHRPFHNYSMKQAIEEGFILDVLKNYTTYSSYYKLIKKVEDDPRFDKKKSQKKLRHYVESNEKTIAKKAEIMVDHFYSFVLEKKKIGGKARAMVVTSSIERAIKYYFAISEYLVKRNSPYKVIIAFSGKKEYNGIEYTEASVNGFPSKDIEETFKNDPYRFLVVADKFQTGYDEPLLHTMYVDKILTDIKAVQTLSRLNRSHPQKDDTFVLDFANHSDDIKEAFSTYYKTTILADVSDPNKLSDLMKIMEKHQIYTQYHVDTVVKSFLNGAAREEIDPILDNCRNAYLELTEDEQVEFKSSAKSFVRTYGFLASILPYGNPAWEMLYIFLNLLIKKLPSPKEDDLSRGILDSIDLDSYRVEANAQMSILLEDSDTAIPPVPTSAATGKKEIEMDYLSNILNSFHEMFGNIDWSNIENVELQISKMPDIVAKDKKYQNAVKNSDKQNARIESERALQSVIFSLMNDQMEISKQYFDNSSFKNWLSDMVFEATYQKLFDEPQK